MTLHESLGFQLQVDGCKHEVIIATSVGPWERSCVCCVDPGLEAFGCQDEVYPVLNLSIRGMSGCYPRQFVGVETVGKDESVALCELWKFPSSFVCLSIAKFSYCSCPVLVSVCVRTYFGIPIALNYKYIIFLGSLCYDNIKLLVKLLGLLVFMG